MWDFPQQTKEELVVLPAQLVLTHLQFQQALLGLTTILSYVVTILDNIVSFFIFFGFEQEFEKKGLLFQFTQFNFIYMRLNTHCSKMKMNGKKQSNFCFYFHGLLGTSPMSKQETKNNSIIGHWRYVIPFIRFQKQMDRTYKFF